MPNYKIGGKAIVVRNRDSCFGNCYDLIEIEGEVISITGINNGTYHIKDKHGGTHCCEDKNLRTSNINRRVM